MSDDLVKRLRDLGDHASFEPHMHHTAADRIEELEAELAEYKYVSSAIDTQWAESQDEIADLKAKLAKAVWALKPFKILAKHHAADAPEWGPFDSVSAQVSIMYLRDAMTTIAELSSVSCANTTGGNDE